MNLQTARELNIAIPPELPAIAARVMRQLAGHPGVEEPFPASLGDIRQGNGIAV